MKTLLKSLLLFNLCCLSATAVEKTDLFEAGKDGYALYRIPGIVVTKQGTVLAYCEARKKRGGDWGPIDVMMRRSTESKQHRRIVTLSPDGATNWSEPRFNQQLLEPICMAGIVRVREPRGDKPGLIAFSNPHNLSRRAGPVSAGTNRDRRNVSIKLSYDEGKTWTANRTLEAGFSGYSDLAVLPDATILCLYERGSTDGKNHFRASLLTMARVTEDWVREDDKVASLPGIVMDGGEAMLSTWRSLMER